MSNQHSNNPPVPQYRRHKSGQGYCRSKGKNVYFGLYERPESRDAYDKWVVTYLAHGRTTPDTGPKGLTVNNLLAAYLAWAKTEYVKNGKPTQQISRIKAVAKVMTNTFGTRPVAAINVLYMEELRKAMVDTGWTRGFINCAFSVAKSIFVWGGMRELLTMDQALRIRHVPGVKKGRTRAPESVPVVEVPVPVVNQTLPFMGRIPGAMVQVQLFAGMRPVEVCLMRPCDIDTSHFPWIYTPHSHKNDHRDQPRPVKLGPRARQIVTDLLNRHKLKGKPDTAYLFSPYEAALESLRQRELPEVVARGLTPEKCYTVHGYQNAIGRACKRGKVPHWTPLQLRHTAATEWRAKIGLEVTADLLGHSKLETTQIYAERNRRASEKFIEEVG